MHVSAAPTYEFTVEKYRRLGEHGILQEDDRVEQFNGQLMVMSPIGIRRDAAVRRMTRHFFREYGDACAIDVQNPLQLGRHSEPQPDLLLLRPGLSDEVRLVPSNVLLLVEVADSTLSFDRTDERKAYARHGVIDYWQLDLTANQLLVFRAPDQTLGIYQEETWLGREASIAPLVFPNTDPSGAIPAVN